MHQSESGVRYLHVVGHKFELRRQSNSVKLLGITIGNQLKDTMKAYFC